MKNQFWRVASLLLSSALLFFSADIILTVNDIPNTLMLWGFGMMLFSMVLVMVKVMWNWYE